MWPWLRAVAFNLVRLEAPSENARSELPLLFRLQTKNKTTLLLQRPRKAPTGLKGLRAQDSSGHP